MKFLHRKRPEGDTLFNWAKQYPTVDAARLSETDHAISPIEEMAILALQEVLTRRTPVEKQPQTFRIILGQIENSWDAQ